MRMIEFAESRHFVYSNLNKTRYRVEMMMIELKDKSISVYSEFGAHCKNSLEYYSH